MPTRTDFLNLSPLVYYEFEESTPPFSDTQSNLANTTNTGTVISSAGTINGGALVGGSGNSQLTFGTGLYSQLETAASWSVIVALKDQPDTSFEFAIERDIGDPLLSIFFTPTVVQLIVHLFNEAVTSVYGYNDTTPITGGDWHTFGVSYNSLNGLVSLYDNGVLAASATIDNGGFDFDQYDFGGGVTEETWISANGARIDNFAVYSTALSSGDMMLLTTPPVPADIYTPTTSLYVGYAEEFTPRVALRVTSPEVFTPSLNLDVRDINVSHITGTSADWRLDVKIDGVAANTISQASTEFAEDESPLAYVEIIPDPGVIDPEEWENKTITIDFIGVDGGADIYSERRFTGKTDLVELNINSGMLKIRATGDIQGKLDAMTTADIDSLVGGSFSPHVFSADDIGYDYAQDVIETVPKSFQIMPNGALVVTEWAAKSLPDITFIDSSRFDDTLDLDRASRSDLVNKATVYVDFRFPRLRQRNMSVNWYSPTAWCDYLTIGYTLCSKDAVDSAFNSTGWTVMGPVIYEDVPGLPVVGLLARG